MTYALPPPTETELRFQARWAEALGDLLGEKPPHGYPPWARRAARDTLRWLPSSLLEKARAHPAEYMQGLTDAFGLRGAEIFGSMPSKDVETFNRVNRTVWPEVLRGQPGYSPKIARALRRYDVRRIPALAKKGIAQMLDLEASARVAYFEGFAFGLDPLANLQRLGEHVKQVASVGERADRSSVRRVLWLHWPEVEAQENRHVLHQACEAWFAASGDRHAVGSFEAFDKFCRREGILTGRPR